MGAKTSGRILRIAALAVLTAAARAMLFNLRNDIGERENLIAQRPDIARRLSALVREWERDVASEATAAQ